MRVLFFLSILLLSGCAVPAQKPASGSNQTFSCPQLSAQQELVVNIALEMKSEGRLHAALANLQSLPDEYPEVRWRRATLWRLLNDGRAEPLYESLLNTCLAAQGHHGLGQLDFAATDYHRALDHFRKAAELAPTDDAIRNDMGLVYLQLGRLPQARFELLTAMELNSANPQPVDNLLTLLLYQNLWREVGSLMESQQLSPDRLRQAEMRVRQLREAEGHSMAEQERLKVTAPSSGAESK